jgi:hypothetical protein
MVVAFIVQKKLRLGEIMKSKKSVKNLFIVTKKVSAKKPSKNFEIVCTSTDLDYEVKRPENAVDYYAEVDNLRKEYANNSLTKAINPILPEGDGWELVSAMFFPDYYSYFPKAKIIWYWKR